MTDASLRDRLERLAADEPHLSLTLDEVVEEGRRIRHRRRLAATTLAGTAVVAAAVAVPVVLSVGSAPTQQLTVEPFTFAGGQTVKAPADESLSPRQQAIADAIRAASPESWTFDFAADRWDGSGVEATADDGTGPGRLLIGISPDPGTQQLHPCQDPEFAAGVSCTERVLADGSVLSLRGRVDSHGVEYVDIALTHPDGGGVLAEAGNFTIRWPLPSVITPEQKRNLVQQSRPRPVYTVEQLAKVAVAVDRAAF